MSLDAPLPPSRLDRLSANLRRMWRDISRLVPVVAGRTSDRVPLEDRLRARMQDCLEAKGGEVSARARAADLGETYLELDEAGRRSFLRVLARDFPIDRARLRELATAYAAAEAHDERRRIEAEMRATLSPARLRLLTQFNALPQGVKFLVDLRADLLRFVDDDPDLLGLEGDLKQLLAAWFDVGFLELRVITWDSPASLLEKLIAYEAVHRIRSWDDLHNRLGPDRRCYAFFHPRMPLEPLIFVQVALRQGMASSIQTLLDEALPVTDLASADTAIFYSISNAQEGLRGIAFGSFLIKQVVDDLAREFPSLDRFATLSPIPAFRTWVEGLSREQMMRLAGSRNEAQLSELERALALEDWRQVLATDWHDDEERAERLKGPLLTLAAYYLLLAKKSGRPLDPVARFHLGNGARVERLNWLADTSEKGLRESAGLMVNYLYELASIEQNHERFASHGTVATSDAVRGLLPRLIEGEAPV